MTLAPGVREAAFSVRAVSEPGRQDEGEERLTLVLALAASGHNASVVQGTATVRIDEADRTARGAGLALGLGAFARAVGDSVVDAVGARGRVLESAQGEWPSFRLASASLAPPVEAVGADGPALDEGSPGGWEAHGDDGRWMDEGDGACAAPAQPMRTPQGPGGPPSVGAAPSGLGTPPGVGATPGGSGAASWTPAPAVSGHRAGAPPVPSAPCPAPGAWALALSQALYRVLAPVPGDATGPVLGARDLRLSGSEFVLTPVHTAHDGSDPTTGPWTLWGRGSTSRYDLARAHRQVAGDLLSARVGFDLRLREDLLVGVAVSRDGGSATYRLADGASGTFDAHATSAHPYVHWRPVPDLGVWAMAGYGDGEVRLDDGVGAEVKTDIALSLAAAGVRREIFERDDVAWALKSDAFAADIEAPALADRARLPSAAARAWRLRASLEAGAGRADAGLSGTFEAGLRLEGGEASRGGGVELGADLAYADPSAGVEARLRGRWMALLRSSRSEAWGASLSVAYDAGVQGLGLSVTAEPQWGQASVEAGDVWEEAGSPSGAGLGGLWAEEASLRVPMRVGYGLEVGGGGRLTPFVEWTASGSAGRRRGGAELALPSVRGFDVRVALYGERASGDGLYGDDRLEGTDTVLEALLSRPLADGWGRVALGARTLHREAAPEVEARLQLDLQF